MPREKKPEGEKFKTLTISLHPRLLAAVKDKAKSEGMNISEMVSAYLESWTNGAVDQLPEEESIVNDTNQSISIDDPRLDEIISRVDTLEALAARVEALEATRQIILGATPSPAKTQVLTESVPNANEIIIPAYEKEERIPLTEEMQILVSERLKAMRSSGMSYDRIHEKTGIPEGSQKKALSPNQSLKSLTRSQYESLMSF